MMPMPTEPCVYGPERREKGRQVAEQARRLYLQDLHDVLAMPAGLRVFAHVLGYMNATGQLANSVTVAHHNIAETILDDLAQAHPAACLQIMGRLRGIDGAHFLTTTEGANE